MVNSALCQLISKKKSVKGRAEGKFLGHIRKEAEKTVIQ